MSCDDGAVRGERGHRVPRTLRAVTNRVNRPRVYRARSGIGRGFKQVGGVGLIAPTRWSSIRGFTRPDAEERFLRRLPLTGSKIYDIGAFHGITTLFFADRAGPTGHVIAFEAHPESCRYVHRHLDLNGIGNVTVRNVAVGARAGEVELVGPPQGDGITSGSAEIQRHIRQRSPIVERLTVPVISIDDDVSSAALPEPDFVKVDVEGMEFDVLLGMREMVFRCRPRLFIEIHGAGMQAKRQNASRLVELLTEYGYSLYHVESDRPITTRTAGHASEGHLYCE
ncbi:MAG: FkbM family methyltransferase [Chloroflexota bacterium]|nr:FkbM family methyltransferase [Chloroflexota bacterium]